MARRHRRGPNRTATRRGRPAPARPDEVLGPEAQPLVAELREALRQDDRMVIIGMLSAIVESLDPAGGDRDEEAPISLPEFAATFMDVDIAETTAALHVIAALTSDELLTSRIARTLSDRRQPVPDHVRDLGRVTVDRAVLMGDELGDGENIILSVRWPSGPGATVVVYVDHAAGTRIKDAMLLDQPVDETLGLYRDLMTREGRADTLEPMSVPDAAETIASALESELTSEVDIPLETGPEHETWPVERPFVQMLVRGVPAGGSVVSTLSSYEDVAEAEVLRDFLASPEAAGLGTGEDVVEAVEVLIAYAAEVSGHALRWSPRTVEVALVHELPFAVGIAESVIDVVPDVLPVLVSYCHRRLGVSGDDTAQTLAAMRGLMSEFERRRELTPARELRELEPAFAAMLAGDHGPLVRRGLAAEVGGEDALDSVDGGPLPAESLDVSQAPEDVRAAMIEIGGWVDRWLDESEDARDLGDEAGELRTACRRFLVTVAVNDPKVLRRRARADIAALAVLWSVGRANGLVGYSPAPVRSADLQEWFGATSLPSGRAQTLSTAFCGDASSHRMGLGSARVLTGRRRAEIVRRRDAYPVGD